MARRGSGVWPCLAVVCVGFFGCQRPDPTPMLAGPPSLAAPTGSDIEAEAEKLSYVQSLERDIALLYAACARSHSYQHVFAQGRERRAHRVSRWLKSIAFLAVLVGSSAMEDDPYPAEAAPYSGVRNRIRPLQPEPRAVYAYEAKAAAEAEQARARAAELNAAIMALHDFIEEHGAPADWEPGVRAEYRVLFEDTETNCLER